jgi:hypothetical protein
MTDGDGVERDVVYVYPPISLGPDSKAICLDSIDIGVMKGVGSGTCCATGVSRILFLLGLKASILFAGIDTLVLLLLLLLLWLAPPLLLLVELGVLFIASVLASTGGATKLPIAAGAMANGQLPPPGHSACNRSNKTSSLIAAAGMLEVQ